MIFLDLYYVVREYEEGDNVDGYDYVSGPHRNRSVAFLSRKRLLEDYPQYQISDLHIVATKIAITLEG
jgi:hypothetical protein